MKCEVIAELGANHNGSLDRAIALTAAARAAGATAIKLQTWTPGMMVLDPSLVIKDGPWKGQNMSQLYEAALMPWAMQRDVFAHAKMIGIECFSSVFDEESLDFLQSLDCPRYKIASFELVDLPLIYKVAATEKPIILSTGMASHTEIDEAVQTARQAGCQNITLLRCTSAYPADGSEAALSTMDYYRRRFGVEVGISDHTPGIGVAVVAAALGATMIEKHLTLSRKEESLDADFSLEPRELVDLVTEACRVERAIGMPRFGPSAQEEPQVHLRRSLYFTMDRPAGHTIVAEDLRTARPALGVAPVYYKTLIGATLVQPVRCGEPATWDSVREGFRLAKRG